MQLVSRHILRALAGPFFWGLVALTGLLLIQQLAPLIDKFGGRGLEPWVIGEAFLLTLPALVALSLPMAVLVATLYGYSQLAGDLELVAMYANGISVWRMARPALIAAIFVTVANFVLYDQLVPRSNTAYNRLQQAVFRTTPTLTFQPGVMNPLTLPYVLQAKTIDPVTSKMTEVTIYDLRDYGTTRVIHAKRGHMMQSPTGADLLFDLYDGTIDEFRRFEPGRFQRTSFTSNTQRIRNITNKLDIATGGNAKGDRDMTGCELLNATDSENWFANDIRRTVEYATRRDLRFLLGLPALQLPPSQSPPKFQPHCGERYRKFEKLMEGIFVPTKAQAQERPPQQGQPPQGQQQPVPVAPQLVTTAPQGAPVVQPGTTATAPPFLVPPPSAIQGSDANVMRSEVQAPIEAMKSYQTNALGYRVEYHKKFAIPLASFCFVLLGMALALKYPRSGIGLVIGASMVIFLGFYILLIGGENVAKRGYLSPFIAIQGPLVIFTLLGLLAVRSANREMGTGRGAGILGSIVEFFSRLRRSTP